MSSIRGGFVSINDTLINIGLSITTALNGEKIFSSHIADLTILNGILMPASSSIGGGEVVQSGGDNPLEGNNFIDIEGINLSDGSIANIFQNTADGATLRVETQLDIQADVDGFIRQQIQTNRMESAILNIGY